MYCWNCGMDNPEGSKVCAACGNPLSVDDIDLLLNLSSSKQRANAADAVIAYAEQAARSGAGDAAAADGQPAYPAYNDNTDGVDSALTSQYVREILMKLGTEEESSAANAPQPEARTSGTAAQPDGAAVRKTARPAGQKTTAENRPAAAQRTAKPAAAAAAGAAGAAAAKKAAERSGAAKRADAQPADAKKAAEKSAAAKRTGEKPAARRAQQESGERSRKGGQFEKSAKQKKLTRQEQSEAVQRAMQKNAPKKSSTEAVAYDAEEMEGQTAPERHTEKRKKKHSALKSVIIILVILLVLAGAALALYFLKTDTVTAISANPVSATSVHVTINTMNGSKIKVVATAPDGTTTEAAAENNQALFEGLSANTEYSFMAESDEGKFLLGNRAATAKTTDMTHLNGFDVLNVTATTAELSLYGTGSPPDSWVITVTPAGGEPKTYEETQTQFILDDLTPDTEYEASVARNDGDVLDGVTSCTFTTLEYTTLETFEETDMTTESISLQWSSTGPKPDAWTITWEGTDGSSNSVNLDAGSTYTTLTDLTPGVTYTITISCPSMQESEKSTLVLTIPSVTVSNVQAEEDEDGNIQVSWEYDADFKPSSWVISCSYDKDLVPTTVSSKKTETTVSGLLPKTEYTITVTTADDMPVSNTNASVTVTTPEAEDYTNYGCSDAEMTLYVTEDNTESLSIAATTFTTSQHISFAVSATYEKTTSEKKADTTYIIRNADGVPIAVYQSNRTWDGDWVQARHTGDLPDCIEQPGSYTLEVYFDNKFLASADFTVVQG